MRPPGRSGVGTPTVFISYTHDDDDAHRESVREFATLLRKCGVRAILDQWAVSGRQDWQAWATRCITEADFVLVVASRGYRRMGDGNGPHEENLGGRAEAALLRDLLQGDRRTWTKKILPVILPGHRVDEIPLFLQPYAADHYRVELTEPGIEGILRVLTQQPRHVPPPLGPPRALAPLSGPGSPSPRRGGLRWRDLPAPVPVIGRSELPDFHRGQGAVVEVHLVPADPPARLGVRHLRDAPHEVARLGRERGLFTPDEALKTGSSAEAAWACPADGRRGDAGLAIHRNGQRSCWFALPRATIGSVLDGPDLVTKVADRLGLLADLLRPLPASIVPAIGMDPVAMVRLAPSSELSASSARFPHLPPRIRPVADDAVSSEDLGRFAREVADELVARLVAVFPR
ncbi:toll/interleukin-1 receptor domain-containing protein [Amycolatopsis sp. PS_44_ISF1]|nr:toll/interleukin-1 receptor domain-containing protein [Amycolatopsis sp. PS_44_ISF1]